MSFSVTALVAFMLLLIELDYLYYLYALAAMTVKLILRGQIISFHPDTNCKENIDIRRHLFWKKRNVQFLNLFIYLRNTVIETRVEIDVGTRARRASVSTLFIFEFSQTNSTSVSIGLLQMTPMTPCWVANSKFRHLVAQIMNDNPFNLFIWI